MQRYVFHFISPKKTQILSKDTDFGPCAICLCNNAFALTARMDNNPLPPGCRYALPWAMCFCAYSATITDMNFRIRIFNFCTSNCTP